MLSLLSGACHFGIGDDLGKAADDIERCAYLVAYILYESSLHTVGLKGVVIGLLQLSEMSPAAIYDICKGCHEEHQQEKTNSHANDTVAGGGSLHIEKRELFANTFHAVDEHYVVDGVVGAIVLAQRLISLFPASCLLIYHGYHFIAVLCEFLTRQFYGFVSLAECCKIVNFHSASVNRALALLLPFLVFLIDF